MTPRDPDALTPEERDLAARLSTGDLPLPSAALDASILAAARAAVAPGAVAGTHADPVDVPVASPRPRVASAADRRRRWPFGVGIAASLLVAIGIAWQLRPVPESAGAAVSEMPAASSRGRQAAPIAAPSPAGEIATDDSAAPAPGTAPQARTPGAPVETSNAPTPVEDPAPTVATLAEPAPAADSTPAPVADTGVRERASLPTDDSSNLDTTPQSVPLPPPQSTALGNRAVVAPATRPAPPPPAPPAPPAPASPAPEASARAADLRTSGARPSPARPETRRLDRLQDATGAQADRAFEPDHDEPPATADSPEFRTAWLARVRELLDAGEIDAARASLTEFHRRHPQAELPADLRALIE
ncbi:MULTISPECIES: hypothetical protein [Luteimonas]|uniref:hypothetical protein n=1 Tax=Luteimonas TaxID=83614 RepID=UPI000C7D71EB|nr:MULTISPECIES: hypothetical protein [Luteimonas]